MPDPRSVAVTNVRFFVIGGTTAFLVSLLPSTSVGHLMLLRVEALLALICGLGIWVAHGAMPRWLVWSINPTGTSMITLAIWLSGGGTRGTAIAMLYAIMPLHAFSFYRTRTAGWLMVLLSAQALSMWWPLQLLPPEIVVAGTCINIVTALTMTSLMGALRRSEFDPVTGLLNRRGFDLALDRSLEASRHTGDLFGVGYLDLDRFREINEARGRDVGDRVLQSVGTLWESMLPPGGLLAHNGGGTFVVLLPGQDVETGGRTLEGLRSASLPEQVTSSAGIATWEADDTASTLLSRADTSLYRAKRSGRNRMDPQVEQSTTMRDLQDGLRRGEFVVLYQPIVELASRQTVAAEALVRWDHPVRGRIGPDEFIPLAEQSGVIVELGLWVLKDACFAVARADRKGLRLDRISVNITGRQLQQPEFPHDVLDALEAAGLAPSRLILEVTESALGEDRALAIQSLTDLRQHGILVAIDDFGTGYSSLSRLTQLPVDILKIDKSFVGATGCGCEEGSAAGAGAHAQEGAEESIIAAVTALADALHLDTVAEGIETRDQAAIVAGFGCKRGQGWLYGRPGSLDDLMLSPIRGDANRDLAGRARTEPVSR